MALTEREATCSCGQLRVIALGDPVRVSVCHCFACQQRTGSSYGYQARFPLSQVTVSGESREFVRLADEDNTVRTFHFCPQCGSNVYYLNGDTPELVAVAVGTFAEPGFPEPDFSVWEERKHGWVVPPPGAGHVG
jgi:hypothetical protein